MAERSKRISVAILCALIASLIAVACTDSSSVSAVRTGDFPAFYSLAVIADSQQSDKLYDQALQGAIQGAVWQEHLSQAVLPGAYPPYVAFLLRPLAWLGPVVGRVVWGVLSVCCLLFAVYKTAELSPYLKERKVEAIAAALSFMPLLVGVVGGQTVAFSAAVYVGLLSLVHHSPCGERIKQCRLGALAGVWLFKPQYALVVLLLLLVARRWWAVASFGAVSAMCYVLGVLVMGLSWPLEWLSFSAQFAEMNFASNSHQMTNLVGAVQQLIHIGILSGRSEHATLFAGVSSLVVVGIWLWWARRVSLYQALVMLAPILAVATPQANFYDLGLCFFPLVLLYGARERGSWLLLIGVWGLAGWAAAARSHEQLPWFTLLAVGTLTLIARRALTNSKSDCFKANRNGVPVSKKSPSRA